MEFPYTKLKKIVAGAGNLGRKISIVIAKLCEV